MFEENGCVYVHSRVCFGGGGVMPVVASVLHGRTLYTHSSHSPFSRFEQWSSGVLFYCEVDRYLLSVYSCATRLLILVYI